MRVGLDRANWTRLPPFRSYAPSTDAAETTTSRTDLLRTIARERSIRTQDSQKIPPQWLATKSPRSLDCLCRLTADRSAWAEGSSAGGA